MIHLVNFFEFLIRISGVLRSVFQKFLKRYKFVVFGRWISLE